MSATFSRLVLYIRHEHSDASKPEALKQIGPMTKGKVRNETMKEKRHTNKKLKKSDVFTCQTKASKEHSLGKILQTGPSINPAIPSESRRFLETDP